MRIMRIRSAVSIAVVSVIAAGCGTSAETTVMSETVPLTPEERAYSDCSELDAELDEHTRLLVNVVDDISRWIEVDGYEHQNVEGFDEVVLLGRDLSDPDGAKEHAVGVYGGFERALAASDPEIERVVVALHDSAANLGLPKDGIVVAVMHQLANGQARMAGTCETVRLNRALTDAHGEGLGAFSDRATQLVGADLAQFALPEPEIDHPDLPKLLNPDSYPLDELAKLKSVLMFYSVDGEVPGMTVCSKTGAGWNDCFGLSGTVPDTGGVVMQGFVDNSGVLEIFATDERASLTSPLGVLAKVQLTSEQLEFENLAIRVKLASTDLNAGRLEQGAIVDSIVDFGEDQEVSEYWNVERVLGDADIETE